MKHSLKALYASAAQTTIANDKRRIHLLTIMDEYRNHKEPILVDYGLLSSLYSRLGNDSYVINQLLAALNAISTHEKNFPLKD